MNYSKSQWKLRSTHQVVSLTEVIVQSLAKDDVIVVDQNHRPTSANKITLAVKGDDLD